MKVSIGMLLLAIFLLTYGVVGLTAVPLGLVVPILALLAGIFILLGK